MNNTVEVPEIHDDHFPYEMFNVMINGRYAKDLNREAVLHLMEQGNQITIIRGKE